MNRKKARHLFLELARRNYLDYYGTLKGFGKIAKFYRDEWKPNISALGGYKESWNSNVIKEIRKNVNM